MLAAAIVVLLAVAGLLVPTPASSAAAPSGWRYTMVAFSNASARDMDVYESSDGLEYTLVRRSAYRPPTGYVRDASIFRHTDGWYYVTYTTADGASIGFARSRDRVNWNFLYNWPVPLCCAFLPGTGDGKGFGSSGSGSSGSSGSGGFE